jgi:hypothetical protein
MDNEKKETPKIIYKYRDWNNSDHRRIITHREIYFSSPLSCDEHHECNLPTDFDSVTEDDLFNFYLRRICKNPNPTPKDFEDACQFVKETSFYDSKHREKWEIESRNELDEFISIFSVSATYSNMHLWDTFAKERKGFCIGIDTSKIMGNKEIFGSCGRVNYYCIHKPPKLKALHFDKKESVEDMFLLTFSLPIIFEDEEEFRFIKTQMVDKKVQLTKDYFKEIILGESMDKSAREEIIKACKDTMPPDCNIYESKYHKEYDYLQLTKV